MGQREEIERLVGQAYADLRLQKWGEFERKVAELSLYPSVVVEDIIREKMGKVQPIRAMRLASIHEAVAAFPEGRESSSPQKEAALTEEKRVPELEKPENARWLALLIDTEGALGWVIYTRGKDRTDKTWRYAYRYRIPYVGVSMKEEEAKLIVDEGARLIEERAFTYERKEDKRRIRYTAAMGGKALTTIHHMKPYLLKFRRLANLCLTLFKHHTYIPAERFDKVITQLFGKYVAPRQANHILLAMSQNQYERLVEKAQKLTELHLKSSL